MPENYVMVSAITIAPLHYSDVIMSTIASLITSLAVVYSTVYSDADQRKHQSSASLAFVWGIHRDRWIPRTKGQLRGKCFHLMTSSWPKSFSFLSGSHWNNIHCAILWYVICVSIHFLTEEKWMYSFTALGTCCLIFSIKYIEAVTIQNNDDQNLEYSGLKCDQAITTKCCTCHDSVTVVTCA